MPRVVARVFACVHYLSVAAAATVAPTALAQTTGTLIGVVTDAATGTAVPGAVIVASGQKLQGEQVAVADGAGIWRLPFLPPGPYEVRVTAPGYLDSERNDLLLRTDRTLKVATALTPSTVTLPEEVVTIRVRPGVDPESAQTGVVLAQAFTQAMPIPTSSSLIFGAVRTFEAAALIAPGAEADARGVGFVGGLSVENRYFVGGFDVTDPNYGTNTAPLVLDFMQEVDVKTGNFLARYGRASAGIVSAVTKSGSNELHGSVFSNVVPRMLFQPDGDFSGSDGEALWTRDRNSKGAYDLDLGVEAGGPILRDRLWFHAGFASVLSRNIVERTLRANVLSDALGTCPGGGADLGDGLCRDADGRALQEEIPSATRRWPADNRTWQYTGKLTWLASPDHTFTLAAFGTPNSREAVTSNTTESRRYIEERDTFMNATVEWTGRFLSRRLLVEALAGWLYDDYMGQRRTGSLGFDVHSVPMKRWFGRGGAPMPLGLFEDVPDECAGDPRRCVTAEYFTGGFNRNDYTAQKFSARLSASYLFSALGAHAAEVGADVERSSFRYVRRIAGGATYRMVVWPTGEVFANAFAQGYVTTDAQSGNVSAQWLDRMTFKPVIFTPALYVQDQWQPVPSLTLNGGVRWELMSMQDTLRPDAFDLDIRDAVAPRLQAVWDPSGRGRSKVAVGWGRFYETPSLTLADASYYTQFNARYACDAPVGSQTLNPRTECALVDDWFDGAPYMQSNTLRPVAPGIEAPYVDQFVVSAEHDVWRDVSVGVEYQGRRLGAAIDDMAVPGRNGDVWYLSNPGASPAFTYGDVVIDPRSMPGVDAATGRTISVPVRRPQRSYDGLTVKVTKLSARGLFGHGSYTLSRLRGDYAGRAQIEADQWDMPGLTTDYDFSDFVVNRRGLLPGDRTHALRVYAGYRWLPTARLGLTVGAGVNSRSGTPVDIRGQAAQDELWGYGGHLAFLVPRGRGGRTPWVTQVDLRAELDYTFRPPWALRFTVDAFNALDSRTALQLDERFTDDNVSSVVNAHCSGNPAAARNPAAAAIAACPDLAYLRTIDGRPITVNSKWGRPTEFQTPVVLRFGAALTF